MPEVHDTPFPPAPGRGQRRWASRCLIFVALTAGAAISCRPRPQGERASGQGSASASAGRVFGSRPEAILEADRLELSASRAQASLAAKPLASAAAIRERLYRIERRRVDGLQAVESYRALEKSSPSDCAGVTGALLEAELAGDAGLAFRSLYGYRSQASSAECRERASRALGLLEAYRPLASVLSELEQEATLRRDPAGAASVSGVVAPGPGTPTSGPVRITRIERYGAQDAARVVVHTDRPAVYSVQELGGDAPRLVVDIDAATYEGPSTFPVGGLVERVRVGQQSGAARVVLDLTRHVEQRVFYLPEPFRLIIDVSIDPVPGQAIAGRRAVTRAVLDPGHGGRDPGAIGPGGLREKDVTLDIAHRAAPLLSRELGVNTILTRDGDRYVSLDERTARGNAFNADLFISIHCNATEGGRANGVMTFVLDHSREPLSAAIAARENRASAAAAVELVNALSRLNDPNSLRASLAFADLLQRSTMASLAERYPAVSDGGVRRAGFYVLAGARMPAVLFETSFISDVTGETRFNTEDFRQRIADGIVNAVRAYQEGLRSGRPSPGR